MVEVKSPAAYAWVTAAGRQAGRYWGRYRLVLVTSVAQLDRDSRFDRSTPSI